MKITKITQQERQKDRYSLYVDEKYVFSLSEGALLESKLVRGQELDAAQLKQWQQASADDKLNGVALRYAAMRLRSRWEVEQYLRRKQASPEASAKILDTLTAIGLLDDEAFARAWISNRHTLKPSSKRKLEQELRAKRVPSSIITRLFAEDDSGDSEQSALHQLIAKKRNLSKYKAEPIKLMQYLARQGFSYDDIKTALFVEEE